ncbi:hypothetical protein FF011L_16060 [Roseimaritima multifibrata]|uniref:Methyltransferase domain-containing protein n=1 Tax=Roseimaritima multifibrata TaxID=1930274 RepID=A0A517MDJ7_9BACT|nr:class I SAM-dependent methyltransferase [Roseimaritima multifibrata]QDS92857.1 hypothetical protein FF011L_16060 [Roseimaritima multifibrata]
MSRPPLWQLPPGVSPGIWDYTHSESIADNYQQFLAETPLVRLDLELLPSVLPAPVPGKRTSVVDLGCGNGRTAIPLAGLGYQVLGVDLSQPMLENLAAEAAKAALSVAAVRANLVQLDCFADESVDHAICLFSTLGMVQGKKYRKKFLTHVCRILRPGGIFLVHAHNRGAWLRHPGGWRRLMRSRWLGWTTADHDFGDHVYGYRNLADMFLHSFSRRELLSALRGAGFKIEQVERIDIRGTRLLSPFVPTIPGGFFVIAKKG